jgi:hypothetical protein
MAETLLQLPDLPRAPNACQGRTLAAATRFPSLGTQELANFLQRMIQNLAPFGITTEHCGSVGVQAGPADKILAGELKKLELLAQARDNATAQFKADFVNQLVTHAANLTRQLAGVNAATIHLLKGTSRVQRT